MSKELEVKLLNAAEIGDVSSTRKLLKNFVNPNVRDIYGISALTKASKGGHFGVVELLLEAEARVNVHDGVYNTPLHHAAKGNYSEVVKLLILNGAKIDTEGGSGLRPIDLTPYDSTTWQVLSEASGGMLPELKQVSEVPIIPGFAIANGAPKKKKKKSGKKGKKGAKKKGKKK